MKKKCVAQLQHRVASTRKVWAFALLNLRAGASLALVCAMAASARADVITVTNTNDSGPGSLRQALADANDGDIINFAVTGTIGLTSGELLVNNSVTISGPGASVLAVNANAKSRVFHIAPGKTLPFPTWRLLTDPLINNLFSMVAASTTITLR